MNQEKELNSSLKLIVASSLFVLIGLTLSKLLSFIYRIIIARYYGPEVYGLFSLTIMIIAWFVSFSSLGLYEGSLRYISYYEGKKDKDKVRYIFKLLVVILFFTSILSGILLYFLSKSISIFLFHNEGLIIFLKVLSFIMPFYVLAYAFLAVIQAFEKIKVHAFINEILQSFIKVSSLALLIFLGIKSNAVIISYSLGILSMFIVSYLYCKYKLPEIFKKFYLKKQEKKKILTELATFSWPLVFLGLLYVIFPYVDSFVIGYLNVGNAGVYNVGIYNAAVPIAGLLTFLPILFIRLFFPMATREFSKKNYKIIDELSKQIEKWVLIVNLPFLLLMIIYPGTILSLIFMRPEYLAAENALRLLAIGFFFISISSILYTLILIIGKTKVILTNIIFTTILNLILNLVLVPKYGIAGAAAGTMITNIVITLILFAEIKYYTPILPLRRKMLRVLFSATISAFLLIYIKQFVKTNLFTIFISVSFFLLTYLFLIFVTRSLDKNDLMILKATKKKIVERF